MGPANLFAVLTIMSFFTMIPVCFVMEGELMREKLEPAYEAYGSKEVREGGLERRSWSYHGNLP